MRDASPQRVLCGLDEDEARQTAAQFFTGFAFDPKPAPDAESMSAEQFFAALGGGTQE